MAGHRKFAQQNVQHRLRRVGVRCIVMGVDHVGTATVRGGGRVRDGFLPQRRVQIGATDKLPRRAVRRYGLLLGDVGRREAHV